MTALSAAQSAAIDTLISRAGDAVLARIGQALGTVSGARAFEIRRRIAVEQSDRSTRHVVFGPIAQLATSRGDGVEVLNVSPALLSAVWREAEAREPVLSRSIREGDHAVPVLDRIALTLAASARDLAADMPANEAGRALALAQCLDLLPLLRPVVSRLSASFYRLTEEDSATLRLLLRDADQIGAGGALRVMEILSASLPEPTAILGVLAQVSPNGASERLLAQSDMAIFGDRLLDAVEGRIAWIETLPRLRLTEADARRAVQSVESASRLIEAFSLSIELSPGERWSSRISALTNRMSRALPDLFDGAPRAVEKAFPMQRAQIAGRMTRLQPGLAEAIDPEAQGLARAHLSFLTGVRHAAATFGCASKRLKVIEPLAERLSDYAREGLDTFNSGEIEDQDLALTRIEAAIQCLALAGEEETARNLMRRVALLGPSVPSQAVG